MTLEMTLDAKTPARGTPGKVALKKEGKRRTGCMGSPKCAFRPS